MHKLVLLLSCLICYGAAGRLTLSGKPGLTGNVASINERQKFILDILWQVQKPLVQTELIEMGKILNMQPELYSEPNDIDLLLFLEQCRNHDIVGRSSQVNLMDAQQTLQLIGVYKFLLLPRDWSTFQRNLCFARLHMNPILLVNALTLVLQERADTQDLLMPAVNEILPELYYDDSVIATAENVLWDSIATSYVKPTLLDVFGLRRPSLKTPVDILRLGKEALWRPWQILRTQMINGKLQGNRLRETLDSTADVLTETKQKIVIPVVQDLEIASLTDDVALNILWNNIMTERIMQINSNNARQNIDSSVLDSLDDVRQTVYNRNRQILDDNIDGLTDNVNVPSRRSNFNDIILADKRDMESDRSRQVFEQTTGRLVKDINVPSRFVNLADVTSQAEESRVQYVNDLKNGRTDLLDNNVNIVNVDTLPVTNIDNERLLRVNRRKLTGINDIMETRDNKFANRKRLNKEVDDTDTSDEVDILLKQRGRENLRETVNGRRLNFNDIRLDGNRQMESDRNPQILEQNTGRFVRNVNVPSGFLNFADVNRQSEETRRQYVNDLKNRRTNLLDNNVNIVNIDTLPVTNIDNDRLLRVNRRKLTGINDITETRDNKFVNLKRLSEEVDDTDTSDEVNIVSKQRRGENLRETLNGVTNNVVFGKGLNKVGTLGDNVNFRYTNQQERGVDITGDSIDDLPTTNINNQRLLYVNRRRINAINNKLRIGDEERQRQQTIRSNDDVNEENVLPNRKIWNRRTGIDDGRRIVINKECIGAACQETEIKERTNDDEKDDIVDISKRIKIKSSTGNEDEDIGLLLDQQRRRAVINKQRLIDNDDDILMRRRSNDRIGEELVDKRNNYGSGERLRGRIENNVIQRDDENIDRILGEKRGNIGRLNKSGSLINTIATIDRKLIEKYENVRSIIDDKRIQERSKQETVKDIVAGLLSSRSNKIPTKGEIFIQTLQQLIARIEMDNLAITLDKNIVTTKQEAKMVLSSTNDVQIRQVIQTFMKKLQTIIDDNLKRLGIERSSEAVLQVIGQVLVERNLPQGNILDQLVVQLKRQLTDIIGIDNDVIYDATLIGNLRKPINVVILKALVQLIESYRQNLQAYSVADLTANGIVLNDIDVDRLITGDELYDADLINLVDQQLLQTTANNLRNVQKKIVARELRLNQQPFTISYDITSQSNQRVVVRTFLGPKLDRNGRQVTLKENRQDFVLLDAFVQQLQRGSNIIQRKSRDIASTTRDVSTLSDIYERVMRGKSLQNLIGSNCQLPQRLILPRGTSDGLPVQLFVVVTPVMEQEQPASEVVKRLCGLGLADLDLDNLPLGFPLDRALVNTDFLTLPNVLVKDDVIFHYSNVRGLSN